MIYFDNNDTTPLDPRVLEVMLPWLKDSFGNPSSSHHPGMEASDAVERSRKTISAYVGAKSKEIIFTSGATESNNLALIGCARANPGKRHLIISSIEHSSVFNTAEWLQTEGFRVTLLAVDNQGYVDPDELRTNLCDDTFLVSIIHGNHETGTMQDLKTLAEIAHEAGAWFHTDAAQTMGKIHVDVDELGIDLASFNAHKLHGPKGVGALYVRRRHRPQPLFHGAGQEMGLRPGTENVSGLVGFAKALEIACQGMEDNSSMLNSLTTGLIEQLLTIPDTHLNGPLPDSRLPGNASISFGNIDGEAIQMHLSNRNVCVSSGSSCGSKTGEVSNVLNAIGLSPREANSTVRFSLSRFNTADEVEQVVGHTREVVELLRKITPIC